MNGGSGGGESFPGLIFTLQISDSIEKNELKLLKFPGNSTKLLKFPGNSTKLPENATNSPSPLSVRVPCNIFIPSHPLLAVRGNLGTKNNSFSRECLLVSFSSLFSIFQPTKSTANERR